MSLYRVKQFIWAVKSLSEDIDTEYVNKFLNKKERKLFNKLKCVDTKTAGSMKYYFYEYDNNVIDMTYE